MSTYNTLCIFNKHLCTCIRCTHIFQKKKIYIYIYSFFIILRWIWILIFFFLYVSDVGPFLALIMHIVHLGEEWFFFGFIWSVTGDDSCHLVGNSVDVLGEQLMSKSLYFWILDEVARVEESVELEQVYSLFLFWGVEHIMYLFG